MNAKEAREIVTNYKDQQWGAVTPQEFHAEGYLAALEGPEVKALVEALDRIETIGSDAERMQGIATRTLTQFRDAVKP